MNSSQMAPLPKNMGKYILLLGLGILLIYAGYTSYYQIEPNETGVKLRLGKFIENLPSGPQFILPFGIEQLIKVPTESVFIIEFTTGEQLENINSSASTAQITAEDYNHLVLTGDLNLALVNWAIHYKIKNPQHYLFRVKNPDETLKALAESVMRRVFGNETLLDAISKKKVEIQSEIQEELQKLVDKYEMGVELTTVQLTRVAPPKNVVDAFMERNRARQEAERKVNEAQKLLQYQEEQAKGERERRHFEALGRKDRLVSETQGELEKYKLLWQVSKTPPAEVRTVIAALESQLTKPDLTEQERDKIKLQVKQQKAIYMDNLVTNFNKTQRERLYLETMRDIYKTIQNKVFLTNNTITPLFNIGGIKALTEPEPNKTTAETPPKTDTNPANVDPATATQTPKATPQGGQ